MNNLLKLSGLAQEYRTHSEKNEDFKLNWAIVKDWKESARYSLEITMDEAQTLYSAVTDGWSDAMVTEMVVKESLTERMISAGSELTRRLNEAGLVVSAVLWFYDPESNDWRLIVASPDVHSKGLKTVYKDVQSVLSTIPENQSVISLKDISVVDSSDPLISLLKDALTTGNGISGIRVSRNMINGTLIEDAYIYRLT